jgi:toxin ParE1/3/4
MADYILSKKAIHDLRDIWSYTAQTWSENQADKYLHYLRILFEEIAASPGIGKNYDFILTGISGHLAGKHIIFYRVKKTGTIQIIRILHGNMDINRDKIK